jgi:hypothetical protein
MRGYSDIVRSTSACVHFVEAREVDQELVETKGELDAAGIRCAYVDCRRLIANPDGTCDAVAVAVGADHAPYGEEHWIRLLDDMISLSVKLPGLVIVLDHADQLFNADRSKIFDLTESFLIQFHHWLGKKKPCHLCFQMSPHPLVGEAFAG